MHVYFLSFDAILINDYLYQVLKKYGSQDTFICDWKICTLWEPKLGVKGGC